MKNLIIIIGIVLLTLLSTPAISAEKPDLEKDAGVICKETYPDTNDESYKMCVAQQIQSAAIVYYAYMDAISKMEDQPAKLLLEMLVVYCSEQSKVEGDIINYSNELQCIRTEIKNIHEKLSSEKKIEV